MYQEHPGITSVSSVRKYRVAQICVHASAFLHHYDCDEAGQLSTPFHWIVWVILWMNYWICVISQKKYVLK